MQKQMATNKVVFGIVEAAIRELNEELGYDSLDSVTAETPLFGATEGLDSISLVQLVTAIEAKVEVELAQPVVLMDEESLSASDNPFRTAGSLAELVSARLERA